jgi:hypothetical protein
LGDQVAKRAKITGLTQSALRYVDSRGRRLRTPPQ